MVEDGSFLYVEPAERGRSEQTSSACPLFDLAGAATDASPKIAYGLTSRFLLTSGA